MTSRSKLLTHNVLWDRSHAGPSSDSPAACYRRGGEQTSTHIHTYTQHNPFISISLIPCKHWSSHITCAQSHFTHTHTHTHTHTQQHKRCSKGRFMNSWLPHPQWFTHSKTDLLETKSSNHLPVTQKLLPGNKPRTLDEWSVMHWENLSIVPVVTNRVPGNLLPSMF